MVNLPFEDVDNLRKAAATSSAEAAAAKAELAALKLSGSGAGSSTLPAELIAGLRAALSVIQWAQGNYDPETVRGWPHAELRLVAETVKAMPGVTDSEVEWAHDANYYADMAAAVERARRSGRQRELNQIPRVALANPGAYAAQVDQILQKPPKDESDSGAGSEPPPEPPPAAA